MWILNKHLKGYIFYFCTIVLGKKIFSTPRVSYPGESVFSTLKYEYLVENETKNENILTRWSVTQAGSNYEKKWGPKLVRLSLKAMSNIFCVCAKQFGDFKYFFVL